MLVYDMSFRSPFIPCGLRFFDKTFEHIHYHLLAIRLLLSHFMFTLYKSERLEHMPFIPRGLNIL
jgi:hypothetical protein